MILSQQLVNDNGISMIALGFFTGLFGMLGILINAVFKDRSERRESAIRAEQAANKAAASADKVVENTKNISNGFANRVLGELSEIRKENAEQANALRKHVEWHLSKEGKE